MISQDLVWLLEIVADGQAGDLGKIRMPWSPAYKPFLGYKVAALWQSIAW